MARGMPPRPQCQVVPSDAPEAALEEVTVDAGEEQKASRLRVCTLNLGGRNTNSFEFLMAGDSSALGSEWQRRFEVAKRAIAEHAPADVPDLRAAVNDVVALVGSPEPIDGTLDALLASATWEAMLEEVKVRLPKLFNVLNLATIKTGRPSPLEAPDGVQPDRELLPQWKEWLQDALPKEREGWEKRLKKRGFPASLSTTLAAMLLFDVMCATALQVHSSSAPSSSNPRATPPDTPTPGTGDARERRHRIAFTRRLAPDRRPQRGRSTWARSPQLERAPS